MEITTLEKLQEYAHGEIVRFPDFAEGQPFVARVRRPSLLALAKAGKIPNSLLSMAGDLFSGKELLEKKPAAIKDLFSVLEVVCTECLVAPNYTEIKDAGMDLTDEQMMFIFNYTQQGVKALEPFRQQPENTQLAINLSEV